MEFSTLSDLCRGRLRRQARRRIPPDDFDGMIAGVGIGAVPHPAVLLALADGAGFLQQGNCPPARRPDRRPSFSAH
jgi:hypothetical protein